MRVAIQYYDRVNLGDDLLVALLMHGRNDEFSLRFPSGHTYFSTHPNVRRIRNISMWRRRMNVAGRRLLNKTPVNNIEVLREANRSDVLVHIGGSIFIEHPQSAEHWRRERAYYAALDVPYLIIDANFGPYSSPSFPDLVGEVLAAASYVSLRDQTSFERFNHLPIVRYGVDLGFLTSEVGVPSATGSDVVVSVMDMTDRVEPEQAAAYERFIRDEIHRHVQLGRSVTMMSFCLHQGDLTAIERIHDKIAEPAREAVRVYSYRGDLEEALGLLKAAEWVVGTRLHASVIGLALGKRVLPVSYSQKTDEVLAGVGYTAPIMGPDRMRAECGPMADSSYGSLEDADIKIATRSARTHLQGLDRSPVALESATTI